jgi:hypothetical protein
LRQKALSFLESLEWVEQRNQIAGNPLEPLPPTLLALRLVFLWKIVKTIGGPREILGVWW